MLKRFFLPILILVLGSFTSFVRAQDSDSTDVETDIPDPIETKSPKTLGEQINEYLNKYNAGAIWGVKVVDLSNGEVLYERNAHRALTPASNMKLYTTATALDVLGADYQYQTDLYYKGSIEDGTLKGDLFIRGSGDPTLGGQFEDEDNDVLQVFKEWSEAFRRMGIRSVTGNVIGDDDVFDDLARGEAWNASDFNNCYAAEISGLAYTENCMEFTVEGTSAGRRPSITVRPGDTRYVNVVNNGQTVGRGFGGGVGHPYFSNNYTFSVRIAPSRKYVGTMPIHNPTLYAATVLQETLTQNGVNISGQPMDVDSLAEKPSYRGWDMRRIATAYSPALSEITKVINKQSHNMYAEHLLKTLGANTSWDGVPRPGSSTRGARVVRDFLRRIGASTEEIIIVDGSGLSKINKVTAATTVRLLEYMWNHKDPQVRTAFYNSLSIAGVDGTLRKRMKSYPTLGNVHAKTGYVGGVRSLSGYVTTTAGTTVAFSLIANNFETSRAYVTRLQDNIVGLIAKYQH